MHIIWNGLLSKAVMLQEEYGSKDLRFFGISIGWFGFGFMVGIDRQPTKRTTDEVTTCPKCGGWLFRETLKTPLPQLDTPCAECGHQKSAHWHRDSGGAYEFADCGGVFDDVCGCKKYRATT